MKKNIIFYIVLFLITSCQRKNIIEDKGVDLKIINDRIYSITDTSIIKRDRLLYTEKERKEAKNIIIYKLTNNSNNNYFFVLDEDFIEVSSQYNLNENNIDSCLGCKKSKLFYNIKDINNKSPKYYSERGDAFKKINMSFDAQLYKVEKTKSILSELNYPKNGDFYFTNSIRTNSFILHPKEVKYFESIVYLPAKEISKYDDEIAYFKFNSKLKYYFNLTYWSNNLLIKQNLPKYKIEELKENNVRIFSGKLVSNKVPIIFR